MSQSSNAHKIAWDRENYYSISFKVPKEDKEIITQAADAAGEGIAEFVRRATLARIGLEEFPHAKSSKKNKESE